MLCARGGGCLPKNEVIMRCDVNNKQPETFRTLSDSARLLVARSSPSRSRRCQRNPSELAVPPSSDRLIHPRQFIRLTDTQQFRYLKISIFLIRHNLIRRAQARGNIVEHFSNPLPSTGP